MKKYISGLAAIVLALTATAFTAHKAGPKTMQWYVLSGTNPSNAGSYTLAPNNGADPNCPTQPTTVCAILADAGTSGHPDQTELDNIATASSNFTKSADKLEYVRR